MDKFLESIGAIWLARALITITIGETVLKPFVKKQIQPRVDGFWAWISDWHRVEHYTLGHDGHSPNCPECSV